ncbi:MAG TPA: TIGR03000 domain-containing protein [Lacipirellulaceae bacterium]|nr:TIGR03000 domain-containing protein [Lacipirellulaceae bacterium]
MRSNMRRLFLLVVVSAIVGAGSLARADHGHGHGGGWGHGGYSHFDGHRGFNGHWGGSYHFYSGHFYGRPYRSYSFWPYANRYFGYPYVYGNFGYPYSYYSYYGYPNVYYGYPYYGFPNGYYSYPGDSYANYDDDYDAEVIPPQEYVVSRPVSDIARLEVSLPDPHATIWVEGKEIASVGTERQFKSPQLDPNQQYTYTIKAEWHTDGKLVTDERKVNVRANSFAVVDFNKPSQAASDVNGPVMPQLPPPQQPAGE